MPWPRVTAVALGIAAILYVMLDSSTFTPEVAPRVTSVGLAILGTFFGVGAWATWIGGERARSPWLAGLAIGVASYPLIRLALI